MLALAGDWPLSSIRWLNASSASLVISLFPVNTRNVEDAVPYKSFVAVLCGGPRDFCTSEACDSGGRLNSLNQPPFTSNMTTQPAKKMIL